jgi:uncharacterized protein
LLTVLPQYLGEEGTDCPVSAAALVSNPWKLETAALNLHRAFFRREVYNRTMGQSMLKVFERHKEAFLTNKLLNVERIRAIRYLNDFDREVQCPTWGYPTEGAYYRDASSADSVMAIRIPTFCLHATDDPIACDEAVPYQEIRQNPYVVMCATNGGGHLSWFESGGGRWHWKPVSRLSRWCCSSRVLQD